MTKTILIVTENENIKEYIESEILRKFNDVVSVRSNRKNASILTNDYKIKVIINGENYDSFIFDEIHHVTKDSLLEKLLAKECDKLIGNLFNNENNDKNEVHDTEKLTELAKLVDDAIKLTTPMLCGIIGNTNKEKK